MNYIEKLNEFQKKAVLNGEGPMMIIAGAGSGKTMVLTYRIAHLIKEGIDPFSIMALTFTNKAAHEMKERIRQIVGNEARNLWMGTFHAVFAKILRFECERLGYTSNFTIYDRIDSKSLIKSIIKDMKLDDKFYNPNNVLSRISRAKNNFISWERYINEPQFFEQDEAAGRGQFSELFKTYSLRCFKANAMDFDDLLFNTNLLFNNINNIDILNKYQHKFKYLLIDEFQDTNYLQYVIIKKISAVYQNICVVGDDAQSIYAFRGADIGNMLDFEKDYPELKKFKLEQNYRSTKNIVEIANSLIKYNTEQLPKKLWTKNLQGEYIQLLKAVTDFEEGKLVANHIFEEKIKNNLSNQDFTILYRTNAQSRVFEENLRNLNIKYKIVGGLSFYQRKEVKDLIAYLRFIANPNDIEAFRRIINFPKRGIGQTTLEKIIIISVETDTTIWEVISNIGIHFGENRFAKKIDDFVTMIKSFRLAMQSKNAFEMASHVAKSSGMLKEFYYDKSMEGRSRYDNLQELLNSIKAFTDNSTNENKNLEVFLQQVSLLTSHDEQKEEDAVTLMTIHMSKGLEFRYVYITGLEENIFPSQLMLQGRKDLEEERRLFYVAITRAKERLILSHALKRYRFGKLIFCEPSRFLEEINSQYLKSNLYKTKEYNKEKKSNLLKQNNIPSGFKSNFPSQIQLGQKIEHPKFGFGIVIYIEEKNNDKKARISFKNFGEKTLMLSFAKLRICK